MRTTSLALLRSRLVVAVVCLCWRPWMCDVGDTGTIVPGDARSSLAPQAMLTIDVGIAGRQFLVSTGQFVTLVFAPTVSQDTVVVAFADQPLSDRSTIVIEPDLEAYVANRMCTPFATVEIALQSPSPVITGKAYAFNGTQIVSDGDGVSGYVTMRYDAPPGATQPISAGLLLAVHDSALLGMSTPVGCYPLERFESRLIPVPNSTVWVFIASEVGAGLVLPVPILKSMLATRQSLEEPTADPGTMMIGRYLPVDLNTAEQSMIHFDLDARAFAYGAIGPAR